MKKIYILFIITFLLSINFSYAYSNTTIKSYWSFGDSSGSNAYDVLSDKHFSTMSSFQSVSGRVGNALKTSSNGNVYPFYNINVGLDFGTTDFALNFWTKFNGTYSSWNYGDIVFGWNNNYDTYFDFSGNDSTTTSALLTCQGNADYGGTTNNTNWNAFTHGSYSMVTIVYNTTSNIFKMYINTKLAKTFSACSFGGARNYLVLNGVSQSYDEMSLWNSTLTEADILTLYNDNVGLSFAETMQGTANPPGVTFYKDICIPYNVLCHVYNLTTNTCPITINGLWNRESCLANCLDNQQYFETIGYTPADFNFSGSCGTCSNQCTENATRCNGDLIEQCDVGINGCTTWQSKVRCGYGCSNSFCNLPGNNVILPEEDLPVGSVTVTNAELWDNFIGLNSDSASDRLIISILACVLGMLIVAVLFFIISYTTGNNIPPFIPVALTTSTGLILFIYFLMIGFIPFWILILMIVIGGTITGLFMRRMIVGR